MPASFEKLPLILPFDFREIPGSGLSAMKGLGVVTKQQTEHADRQKLRTFDLAVARDTTASIGRRALEITASIEAKCGPYSAEIVPNCTPLWHVIRTAPSAEGCALRHLVDRGFGVYQPWFDGSGVVRRGPIFPRHLFIFVWDVLLHWRRICATPGVGAIWSINEQPIVMPDREIARIQMVELAPFAPTRKPRVRARGRQEVAVGNAPINISIQSKSYWSVLPRLAEDGRIDLLRRALGLSS